jgi:hypothetical protein
MLIVHVGCELVNWCWLDVELVCKYPYQGWRQCWFWGMKMPPTTPVALLPTSSCEVFFQAWTCRRYAEPTVMVLFLIKNEVGREPIT